GGVGYEDLTGVQTVLDCVAARKSFSSPIAHSSRGPQGRASEGCNQRRLCHFVGLPSQLPGCGLLPVKPSLEKRKPDTECLLVRSCCTIPDTTPLNIAAPYYP
ncbi:unnamed protein product, partial [Urochloa humidicola]